MRLRVSLPIRRCLQPAATTALAAALFGAGAAPLSAATLDGFNVEPNQITVSGISSGGYMATQFHVAFSGSVIGAGILAAGPYYCAKGNVATALTDCTTPTAANPPDVEYSVRATESFAAQGWIDAPANLARSKVWLFSGSRDATVLPVVAQRLAAYYARYVPSANIRFETSVPAAHSMVTDGWGHPCGHAGDGNNPADTFINDCDYDAAGALLTHLLGPLKPRSANLGGRFVEFDQAGFIAEPGAHSMDATGRAYVPAACDAGERCRIHVAFHGCQQYPGRIGQAFVLHAGYNAWADANRLIVLYPQTAASALPPVYNPKGCWDWWGYDDPQYATRQGRQMAAVKAMVDRLTSGYVPAAPAAPQALTLTGRDDHGVSLSWSASTGPRADVYRVYVASGSAGSPALVGSVDSTAAKISGLASGTSYTFTVRTVSRNGAEGPPSAPVTTTTTGLPGVPVNAVTLIVP